MNANHLTRILITSVVVLTPIGTRADEEQDLIKVLSSSASVSEKCAACARLRMLGTARSVPALAAMLSDERTSHAARYALEASPCPEAGAALCEAVSRTSGSVKAGLLDSLGWRREPRYVPTLTGHLGDADATVASAAATALGRIGGKEAVTALLAARDQAPPSARPAVLESLLKCAEQLLASGDNPGAASLYRELSAKWLPPHVRAAAWRGLRQATGSLTAPTILESLASEDPVVRTTAAGMLQDLSAVDLQAVAHGMARLPAESQQAILAAVRTRGDQAFAPVVMEAVRSDSQDVRLAAVRALGAVGDDAAVPLLVRLARAKDSIAEAAWQSLEMIIAPGIDQRLLAILRAEKDPAQRAAWIGLLESRRASGAVQAALSEALHPSEEVRRRALEALAALAEPTDVPNMIAMLLKIEAGAERDQAEKAVMAVCQQIADVEQRAQPVIDVLRNVSAPDRKKLLPLLGRIGGAAARQTVREALASKDPELYAAGVRALCNWPDASVADQLSELAQSGAEQGHRMAALRAFIRVVSLPGKPDDQRLSLLKRAMNLAARDDERNLVLQRTAAVTSIEALRFLLPHLDQPALASQACQSVVELARHGELREPNKKEFASALEKVLRTSREPATLEEARRCLGK